MVSDADTVMSSLDCMTESTAAESPQTFGADLLTQSGPITQLLGWDLNSTWNCEDYPSKDKRQHHIRCCPLFHIPMVDLLSSYSISKLSIHPIQPPLTFI